MAAQQAAGGYVVTSGRFTKDAIAFAEGRNIELIDGEVLGVTRR
jgi:restriction system protein